MKVYISYSAKDEGIAQQLLQDLRHEGLEVWNPNEIFPGENWALETGRALEEADSMVVLLTPNSANSRFVERELGYALGDERFEGRVIPVVFPDTGPQSIPWVLRLKMFQMLKVPSTGLDASVARQIAHALNVPQTEPRQKAVI